MKYNSGCNDKNTSLMDCIIGNRSRLVNDKYQIYKDIFGC